MKYQNQIIVSLLIISLAISCRETPNKKCSYINKKPVLYPDYAGVTIPVNIAPLNFNIEERGDAYFVQVKGESGKTIGISSKEGTISFPLKKWKNLLKDNQNGQLTYTVFLNRNGEWQKFEEFQQNVRGEKVDPYLYYRLLYPGYTQWKEISIMQRNLDNFRKNIVVQNNAIDQNCINCHSFNLKNPENFLFHARGSFGGTYFLSDKKLKRVNLKTNEMSNGAVYPRWHPSGRFVAFSSNKIGQRFHAANPKGIEVMDINSSIVLYDIERNEIMKAVPENNGQFMDTYPEWSPDGKTLYFCRAEKIKPGIHHMDIHYDLYSATFDPEIRKFGKGEPLFLASSINNSASFPRISPDGKTLVFTLHNYGCFPIWHKEADLYSIDLDSLKVNKLPVNSDFTESYHSWSSNGKWIVFSSKRGDGLSARPYFAYFGENGKVGKPFVLPQENPLFYRNLLKTYNIPELAITSITFDAGQLRRAANSEPLEAIWMNN